PAHEARLLKPSDRLLECSQCHAVQLAGEPCRHCGFRPKRPAEYLHVIDGELAHVDRTGKQHPHHYTDAEKRLYHRMLLHLAIEPGNNRESAAHRFKDKFGHWPLDRHVEPYPANAEVRAFDRHCRIRYAKSMERAASNG